MEDFKRAEELRQAATRAWAALDSRSKLLKSLRGRHRLPQTFVEGQLVFVWRQPKVGDGRWTGPGIVVLDTTGGAWVNMRGSLWRVANEQMRAATNEESLGAEIVNRYLVDMRENLRNFKSLPLLKVLNMSINNTLSRTIMTSVTTLLALFALYFLGGDVIRGFTFAMIWGVLVGTYSSIFVAAKILLILNVKRNWDEQDSKAGTQF